MFMDVLPACMSVHHMRVWCRGGQRRVSDPLELELQTVVSHHVGVPLEEQPVLLIAESSLQALSALILTGGQHFRSLLPIL